MSSLPFGRRLILIVTTVGIVGIIGITALMYLSDESVPLLNKGASALSTVVAMFLGLLGGLPFLVTLLQPKTKLSDEEINSAFAELAAADTHLKQQQFAKAAEKATAVIKLLPKKAEAYRIRAKAYEGLSKFASALEDYEVAITLEPGYPFVHCGRASLLKSMGEYERAIPDMLMCIGMTPELPSAYFQLADIYFSLGHYEQAEKVFRQILSHTKTTNNEKDMAKEFLGRIESLAKLESDFGITSGMTNRPKSAVNPSTER